MGVKARRGTSLQRRPARYGGLKVRSGGLKVRRGGLNAMRRVKSGGGGLKYDAVG